MGVALACMVEVLSGIVVGVALAGVVAEVVPVAVAVVVGVLVPVAQADETTTMVPCMPVPTPPWYWQW